jgi:hypothetical protein
VLLLPVSTTAVNLNPTMHGDKPPRTSYGLRIARGNDDPYAQAEPELPIAGLSLARYLGSIDSAEQAGGVYSADLVEPLEDMGRAFQAEEKHREAMDVFKRALHLARINEGLYSTSQLPLLGDMIKSHLAMGQLFDADDKQYYRFRLQQRAYEPGDAALLQAAAEFSEWQRQAYLDGFSGNTYRRVVEIYDVNKELVEQIEAIDANHPALVTHLYQRMQAEYLISQYEGEKDPEFQFNINNTMEAKFAMSTDPAVDKFQYLQDFNYRNGINTMERIIEIERSREPVDVMALARAQVALGDWYLWWDARSRALQNYEAAWTLLAEDGSRLTNPDALFAEPVELPDTEVFRPGTITARPEQQALATVMFNVSRVGKPVDIRVVEQDPADHMGARVNLFDMIRDMRFRPVVREGKATDVNSVVRVYRFDY